MSRKRTIVLGIACAAAVLGMSGWVAFRTWLRPMRFVTEPFPPVRLERGTMIVALPTKILLAEVGKFDDELSAYLWFDYLRSRPSVEKSQVLLTVTEREQAPVYGIEIVVPNDALAAIPWLADLEAKGFIEGFNLVFTTPAQVEYRKDQTSIFVAAYKRPVDKRLETLPRKRLLSPMARFLAFKSRTDPRVRGASESRPSSLSHEQATELATDIIAASDFYNLPLDVFLGIGAMENNYLSIRGDINHAIWKRSPRRMTSF